MIDPAPRRGPLTRTERLVYVLFLVVVLGLFVAEVCTDYEPVKLSALLVVLFWIPLLAFHEAGHALAARLLGWYVGRVVIGMGRTVSRFRLGRATVEIRLIPVEGFVQSVPTDLHFPRLKNALIYFAGPGVELLLAGLILFLVGPAELLSRSDDYGLIVWQSLALAAAASGILNLIPHSVRTQQGEVPNDGLGIIRSFLLPEGYYAELIGMQYVEERDEWESPDPADWWKR